MLVHSVPSLPLSFLQRRRAVGTRAGAGMASPRLLAACGSVLRTPACCGAGEVRRLVRGLSNAVWRCAFDLLLWYIPPHPAHSSLAVLG